MDSVHLVFALRAALDELLSKCSDPTRKLPDSAPARGLRVTFNATVDLQQRLIALRAALDTTQLVAPLLSDAEIISFRDEHLPKSGR